MVTTMLPSNITVGKLYNELAERYLDFSNREHSIYALPLNPNLSLDELEDAKFWRAYARGTMGVFAPPRTGKTLFLIIVAAKMCRYFMRPVVMDFHPRQKFIDYVGEENITYIDEKTLLEDMQEIDKLSRDKGWNMTADDRTEWVVQGKGSNRVKLFGCTLLLSEMKKWTGCRRTGTKINELIGYLFDRWGHQDLLIAGDAQRAMDLDRQQIGPAFTITVQPKPLGDDFFEYIIKSTGELGKGGMNYAATTRIYTIDGRDWFEFYWTRNPVALPPSLRVKESKKIGGNGHGI